LNYQFLLLVLGVALCALAVVNGGWWLLALWPGADFLVLGIAHYRGGHGLFGKRPDGSLPWWSWLVFFPFLIYVRAVWMLLNFLTREPAFHQVTDTLVIGRRLAAREVEGDFDNYLDLTSEFAEPGAIRRRPGYCCLPLLDGGAPEPEVLQAAIARLRPGKTFVHCAQGHGRTGLFALAWLLHTGAAANVDEGLRMLQAVRPGVSLNRVQRRCIEAYASMTNRSRRP
jgi:hypothetical protein